MDDTNDRKPIGSLLPRSHTGEDPSGERKPLDKPNRGPFIGGGGGGRDDERAKLIAQDHALDEGRSTVVMAGGLAGALTLAGASLAWRFRGQKHRLGMLPKPRRPKAQRRRRKPATKHRWLLPAPAPSRHKEK